MVINFDAIAYYTSRDRKEAMIGMKIEIGDLYTKSGLYTLRIIGETLLKLLMLVKKIFLKVIFGHLHRIITSSPPWLLAI